MIAHMRIHTGEKPYQCKHCPKVFRERSAWVRHIDTHLGRMLHQCHVCGKGFGRKDNYVTHLKTHQHEKKVKHKAMPRSEDLQKPDKAADNTMFIKIAPLSDTIVRFESVSSAEVVKNEHNCDSMTMPISEKVARTEPISDSINHTIVRIEPNSDSVNRSQPVSHRIVRIEPICDSMNRSQPVSHRIVRTEPISDSINTSQPVSHRIVRTEPISDSINTSQSVSARIVRTEPISDSINTSQSVSARIVRTEPIRDSINTSQPVSHRIVRSEAFQSYGDSIISTQPISETVTVVRTQSIGETVVRTQPISETVVRTSPISETVVKTRPISETVVRTQPISEPVLRTQPVSEASESVNETVKITACIIEKPVGEGLIGTSTNSEALVRTSTEPFTSISHNSDLLNTSSAEPVIGTLAYIETLVAPSEDGEPLVADKEVLQSNDLTKPYVIATGTGEAVVRVDKPDFSGLTGNDKVYIMVGDGSFTTMDDYFTAGLYRPPKSDSSAHYDSSSSYSVMQTGIGNL